MNRLLPIIFAVVLVVLIAIATIRPGRIAAGSSPEGTVKSFFDNVRNRDWAGAYGLVSQSSNIDQQELQRDLGGRDQSLRTFSSLQKADLSVLRNTGDQADVRANLTWSTAVGAFYESRDLKVVKENGDWRVVWPVEKQAKLSPQIIPVNFLRWDIVRRNTDDDWGAQSVEAPRVKVTSMNAIEKDGSVIIMGELVNEDTVPGFVSVSATLIGQNGQPIGEETSFDKIQHTLLPKEVTPFRIDFPKTSLKQVKNVKLDPKSVAVPASADPVIAVLNQRIEKDARGNNVLKGELMNQSGTTVNIPHVIATYYDNSGRVIWVTDGYVDKALLPQNPVPFSLELRHDVAANVHNSRVVVNQYSVANN